MVRFEVGIQILDIVLGRRTSFPIFICH